MKASEIRTGDRLVARMELFEGEVEIVEPVTDRYGRYDPDGRHSLTVTRKIGRELVVAHRALHPRGGGNLNQPAS